jgi:hypothetical protein
MIRGRVGFDSIVAPRWSQSEFFNGIELKADIEARALNVRS